MGILDAERRQQIVALVDESSGQTVAELSTRFGVSPATIRRDLVQLSERGLVERAHGGAAKRVRGESGIPEPPLLTRAAVHADEKRRIGTAAAAYVRDGETIIVSGGTTTAQMVPHLSERTGLTVITNALNIVLLLASYPHITVIVPGGALRHSELTVLGSLAEDALQNLRADKLFMGSPAIHIGYGLSAENLAESRSDQILMASSREVIVLADPSKFGRVATVRVAPIKEIGRVITTNALDPVSVSALQEQGVRVDLA